MISYLHRGDIISINVSSFEFSSNSEIKLMEGNFALKFVQDFLKQFPSFMVCLIY